MSIKHPVEAKLENMAEALAAHVRPLDMRLVERNDALFERLNCRLFQFGDRRRAGVIYARAQAGK